MFKEIDIKQLSLNAPKFFEDNWALLTAGTEGNYNTMTIGWGTIGSLWGKSVCEVFVRDHRYTYAFMQTNDFFTVCFFPPEYKKALAFCGTKSGRDYDKAKETGLTAVTEDGLTYFEQANIVIVCRKIYAYDISEDLFIDKSIVSDVYPKKDFHRAYVGQIVRCMVKE